MFEVSVFQNFTKVLASRTIPQIIDAIRAGAYAAKVADIRRAVQLNNKTQADRLKRTLPAFTPSGRFAGGRTPAHLLEYIPLVVLDLDKLPLTHLPALRTAAEHAPYTHACFLSPSGNGLKILVRAQSTPETHTTTFYQVVTYFEELLNKVVKLNQTPFPKYREEGWGGVDRSGKDLTRLCFLSDDPQAYYNPDSKIFEPLILNTETPSSQPSIKNPDNPSNPTNPDSTGLAYTPGSRNNYIYRFASHANRLGIPEPDTLADSLACFDLDPKEIAATVRSAYKHHKDEFAKFPLSGNYKKSTGEAALPPLGGPGGAQAGDLTDLLLSTPTIPDSIIPNLPEILRDGCAAFPDFRERDVFLTSAIAVLSACLPNIEGVYDRRINYPNLFAFIIAPPANGKGALTSAKDLGNAWHAALKAENEASVQQYRLEQADYKIRLANHKIGTSLPEEPLKPPKQLLFIPANSSSAMVIRHLRDSGGSGLMCETEADTIGNTLKQDWGGYSDLLRKAFHFERISYSRKGSDEFTEIDHPRLSLAISGTPNQVLGLIPSVQDGLFSRFIFYVYGAKPHWRDVSPTANTINLTRHFQHLSEKTLELARFFEANPATFTLAPAQWQHLNQLFSSQMNNTYAFFGADALSTVKRLGAIQFRVAMILTACRKFENADATNISVCEQLDFEIACLLTETWLEHALFLFEQLPHEASVRFSQLPNHKKALYQMLPDIFQRKDAIAAGAAQFNLSESTVDRFLKILLETGQLTQPEFGGYAKVDKVTKLTK